MGQLAMTAAQAIEYAQRVFEVPSAYAMAKALSDDTVKVQPIQIANYLNGTRMSKKVADRFHATYGITITDAFTNENWAKNKND